MEVIRDYHDVEVTNNVVIKIFFRMVLGLLATALVAFYTFKSGLYITIASSMSFAVLAIIEIAVVLLFSFLFNKLSPLVVTVLFYAYAFINGLTLGVIFAIYDMSTISYAFLTTAALFGGLALYGYYSKTDQGPGRSAAEGGSHL